MSCLEFFFYQLEEQLRNQKGQVTTTNNNEVKLYPDIKDQKINF